MSEPITDLFEVERRYAPRLLDGGFRLGDRIAPALETELRCIGLEPNAVTDAVQATRPMAMRVDHVAPPLAHRLEQHGPRIEPVGIQAFTRGGTLVLAGSEWQFTQFAHLLEDASAFDPPAGDEELQGGVELARMIRLMLERRAQRSFPLACRSGHELLADACKPLIMGVVNVTPDSFSDGGQFSTTDAAVAHALQLVTDGADLLDVGGESTRPGADAVSEADELARVVPVIQRLAEEAGVPISIDSTKPAVVRAALEAGASIINDVTGFAPDGGLGELSMEFGAPCILMHMQGTPRTMQQEPHYDDLMAEICAFFRERTAALVALGIPRDYIVLDPGFGFGKAHAHNLEMLRRLREFASLGQPLLVGISRKSMLGRISGAEVTDRVPESLAVHLVASLGGAHMLRVHDVRETRKMVAVRDALAAE